MISMCGTLDETIESLEISELSYAHSTFVTIGLNPKSVDVCLKDGFFDE
jgi:hypothetical protein